MSIAPERSRPVFRKLERSLAKLPSGKQRESVHDFRTSARRLQTLLEDVLPDQSRNQKKLLRTLSRIRKRAGKVRDLEVQLAALRSLKIPQEPRRKTQLVDYLLELHAEREKNLRKALTKEMVREVRKRLKKAEREVKLDSGDDPLAVGQHLLAQVTMAGGPLTEDVLHQYRILGKRARYAAEFAAKSAEGERFIAQLKQVQDALGDWHDWLMLTQTATKQLGDVRESSLVAVLHNVTGAKFRNAVSAISGWKREQQAAKQERRPAARKAGGKSGVTDTLASSAA